MKDRTPKQFDEFIRFAANLWAKSDFGIGIEFKFDNDILAKVLKPETDKVNDLQDYCDAVELFRDTDKFFSKTKTVQQLQFKRQYFEILLRLATADREGSTDEKVRGELEVTMKHFLTLIEKVSAHIDSLN